jgi:type I restriction enzyme R subunit
MLSTETERGLRVDTASALHKIVLGMNVDNFLVRPHRRLVEQYAQWPAWSTLTVEVASDIAGKLAGLPSSELDSDE